MVAGYRPPSDTYDEMLGADGALRPHWRTFMDGLTAMGGEGRTHAAETAARMLHENDVTYVTQSPQRRNKSPVAAGHVADVDLAVGVARARSRR